MKHANVPVDFEQESYRGHFEFTSLQIFQNRHKNQPLNSTSWKKVRKFYWNGTIFKNQITFLMIDESVFYLFKIVHFFISFLFMEFVFFSNSERVVRVIQHSESERSIVSACWFVDGRVSSARMTNNGLVWKVIIQVLFISRDNRWESLLQSRWDSVQWLWMQGSGKTYRLNRLKHCYLGLLVET